MAQIMSGMKAVADLAVPSEQALPLILFLHRSDCILIMSGLKVHAMLRLAYLFLSM